MRQSQCDIWRGGGTANFLYGVNETNDQTNETKEQSKALFENLLEQHSKLNHNQ